MSDAQRQQAQTLLEGWRLNHVAVHTTEQRVQVSLEEACRIDPNPYTTAELCDRTELLLSSTALRLEVDLSLIMSFVHCVLTPSQVACFVAASYPSRPDWQSLCIHLATSQ